MHECEECFSFTARLGWCSYFLSFEVDSPAWAQTAGDAVIAINEHFKLINASVSTQRLVIATAPAGARCCGS